MRGFRDLLALAFAGALFASPALGQIPISALPSATTPTSTGDVAPIVQGGVTKKVGVGSILPNTAVTPGTYGDASHCVNLTVQGDGRLTAAAQSTSCPGGGGGGVERRAAPTPQMQYNNSGSFGGIPSATYNGSNVTLTSPALITPAPGHARLRRDDQYHRHIAHHRRHRHAAGWEWRHRHHLPRHRRAVCTGRQCLRHGRYLPDHRLDLRQFGQRRHQRRHRGLPYRWAYHRDRHGFWHLRHRCPDRDQLHNPVFRRLQTRHLEQCFGCGLAAACANRKRRGRRWLRGAEPWRGHRHHHARRRRAYQRRFHSYDCPEPRLHRHLGRNELSGLGMLGFARRLGLSLR